MYVCTHNVLELILSRFVISSQTPINLTPIHKRGLQFDVSIDFGLQEQDIALVKVAVM